MHATHGIHITLTVANRRSIEEHLLTHQVDLAVMSLVRATRSFHHGASDAP